MSGQSQSLNVAYRVLVVVSRPLDQKELPYIADQWALINGLATVKAPVEIKILHPPTIEQLRTEILSGYDIFHFDGHGAYAVACPKCKGLNAPSSRMFGCGDCGASLEMEIPSGYLAFEQEDGLQDALAADELTKMLRAVPKSPTKLVVLSACESAKGGDTSLATTLQNDGIPAVLGMKETVLVSMTIALSVAFYAALGAGMTIYDAFHNCALPALSRFPNNSITGTRAIEIPKLQGNRCRVKIMTAPVQGQLILEQERLFGVPDYDFVGEFIRGDPPRGRKGVLIQCNRALLGDKRLVMLAGQAGIGKSVLAASVARRIAWRYPGGIFWRNAADMELNLTDLLDIFTNVFGYKFRAESLNHKRDSVLNYLRDLRKRSLIVVDNAEKVKDDNLWNFLEGLPEPSSAMITTRDARTRDWLRIDVPKLEYEEAIGQFEEVDGIFENRKPGLFIYSARRAINDHSWGEIISCEDRNNLDEINQLLDGHPLGIELAAALIASSPLEGIKDMLHAAPPSEVSERFDFSYNNLTSSQKLLLHKLAAFSSSFADWAVSGISSHEDDNPRWRQDINELVRKSFMIFNELGIPRYRIHPLMRQYVTMKSKSNEIYSWRDRIAQLFLEYASKNKDNFENLDKERDNLLASMDWAAFRGDLKMERQFGGYLDLYLSSTG